MLLATLTTLTTHRETTQHLRNLPWRSQSPCKLHKVNDWGSPHSRPGMTGAPLR